jgi:hypothetical protein
VGTNHSRVRAVSVRGRIRRLVSNGSVSQGWDMNHVVLSSMLWELAETVASNDLDRFDSLLGELMKWETLSVEKAGPMRAAIVVALRQAARRMITVENGAGVMCPLCVPASLVVVRDIETHLLDAHRDRTRVA